MEICSIWRRIPLEVLSTTADSVEGAVAAGPVPESTAAVHCTILDTVMDTAGPRVVVTVIRGEHHAIVVAECISDSSVTAREPRYP